MRTGAREKGQFGTDLDRTGRSALPLPKQVRYRAAPHPEISVNLIISLSLLCLEVGGCASYHGGKEGGTLTEKAGAVGTEGSPIPESRSGGGAENGLPHLGRRR